MQTSTTETDTEQENMKQYNTTSKRDEVLITLLAIVSLAAYIWVSI